jgi:hypothetical protein
MLGDEIRQNMFLLLQTWPLALSGRSNRYYIDHLLSKNGGKRNKSLSHDEYPVASTISTVDRSRLFLATVRVEWNSSLVDASRR